MIRKQNLARPTQGPQDIAANEDLEDLNITDADDPTLGLTNIGDVPAEDWAADTGPTRSGEATEKGVDHRLEDEDGQL